MAEADATARRVNAEPWQPLPGMVKLCFPDCRYWFAVAVVVAETEPAPCCPDCTAPPRQ
jgi:hypothetical protein